MSIETTYESERIEIWAQSTENVIIREVEIERLPDGRRIVSYDDFENESKKNSLEVPTSDKRSNKELLQYIFLLQGRGTYAIFKRKQM